MPETTTPANDILTTTPILWEELPGFGRMPMPRDNRKAGGMAPYRPWMSRGPVNAG